MLRLASKGGEEKIVQIQDRYTNATVLNQARRDILPIYLAAKRSLASSETVASCLQPNYYRD